MDKVHPERDPDDGLPLDPHAHPSFWDGELEELLRRQSPHPKPARALRRRVRQRFFSRPAEGVPESESLDPGGRRTAERLDTRLEQKLAAEPLAPPADAEFRAELRARFVEDSWDENPEVELLAGEAEAEDPASTGARGGRLLRLLLPVAAAAAILFVMSLPTDPTWEVEFLGSGSVTLDDVPFRPSEYRQLGAILSRSGTLATGENTLSLRLDASLTLRLLPGTRIALADLPPLDGSQPIFLSLHSGEIYMDTTPDYPGNPIRVVTDLADVEVLGTTLGVLSYDGGFCVCVTQGSVQVRNHRDGEEQWRPVPQDHRFYVPTDPRGDIFDGPLLEDPHAEGLRLFTIEMAD